MSITLPNSRALLRLALASIALVLGLGRAAVASEVTTPVEQLHAGLMAIMQAGKTAPFRQRYDMIAHVIGWTFDLEVIGPRLAALPPDQRAAVGEAFQRYVAFTAQTRAVETRRRAGFPKAVTPGGTSRVTTLP